MYPIDEPLPIAASAGEVRGSQFIWTGTNQELQLQSLSAPLTICEASDLSRCYQVGARFSGLEGAVVVLAVCVALLGGVVVALARAALQR